MTNTPDSRPADGAGPADLSDSSRSDPAAWVDLHGDGLYRYALLRVRDRELAEELVQETFLAALRGRAQFAGRSSERTWLIGILRRKVADHFRSAGRSGLAPGDDMPDGSSQQWFDRNGHWRDPVLRWPGDAARTLEKREFWDVLDGCLSKLSHSLLAAFCLRELEGIESAEICKILNVTASNLWTQLHRARMLLRVCLERNWFARTPEPRNG
jgi:RNA polymerase sigma-70 factor (ECF subfamily)